MESDSGESRRDGSDNEDMGEEAGSDSGARGPDERSCKGASGNPAGRRAWRAHMVPS